MSSLLIMQARLSSSRLLQKALLPINQVPSLLLAMQGVHGVAADHVLACDEHSVEIFRPLAQTAGYQIVGGALDDVLGRFVKVLEGYDADYIIRATADNVIVGKKLVKLALARAKALDADYFCFTGTPHGSGVEIVRTQALLQAHEEAIAADEREHVTLYLYRNEQLFKICREQAPKQWLAQEMRSTLDTQEDYERLVNFFKSQIVLNDTIIEDYIRWMHSV